MQMPLSDNQIAAFRQDGYLVLRNLVSPASCEAMLAVTLDHVAQAIPPFEYEADVGYPGAPQSTSAVGGKTIRRLLGAYHRHACFQQWAQDRDFIARLTQLFDEPVCLSLAHHNCVMTKHPQFGTATGWHRDIRYWSFTSPDLISVWLALGEENQANGGLKIIPGWIYNVSSWTNWIFCVPMRRTIRLFSRKASRLFCIRAMSFSFTAGCFMQREEIRPMS